MLPYARMTSFRFKGTLSVVWLNLADDTPSRLAVYARRVLRVRFLLNKQRLLGGICFTSRDKKERFSCALRTIDLHVISHIS